jgi:hypothetical protein
LSLSTALIMFGFCLGCNTCSPDNIELETQAHRQANVLQTKTPDIEMSGGTRH